MEHEHIFGGKRTKIVGTLGPASNRKPVLQTLVQAGLNAARLNFSHGSHQSHAQLIALVRDVAAEMGCPIPIIGDLRGPHIRVGDMEGGSVTLADGQSFILTPEPCLGTTRQCAISYPRLAQDLSVGSRLLLDDGAIHMQVSRLHPDGRIEGAINRGGTLASRRGVNVPGTRLSLPPLTQKDLDDIEFAVAQGIDFLALSFVQSANDVKTLKTLLAAKDSPIAVIAKIEMSSAVDDIEAIVSEADAVMVARGDMALEMSFKEVPIAQKRIITTCRQKAVPVITATQMLESMIGSSKPTRAEVTDVANAIFDGTDALMLSAETAIGQFPVETVAIMARIAARAEEAWRNGEVAHLPEITPQPRIGDIISYSSATSAQYLQAAAIVTYTRSGGTARRISRFRPQSPILALTPQPKTCNQLALSWGVSPVTVDTLTSTEAMTQTAVDYAARLNLAHPGDYIVITSGKPTGPSGKTSLITIERVQE
ncbi:MAG: pyruvate kinase [Anaerolineae bacterium]